MFFEINPCSKILKGIKNGHFAKAIVNQNGKNGLYSATNMLNDSKTTLELYSPRRKEARKSTLFKQLLKRKNITILQRQYSQNC